MATTISDIARLANVSKAAVSAALNNKPGISDETRDKILAIVGKMNYRPSQVARSLSNKKTQTIGLLIKEIDNPYCAKIVKGVVAACNRLNYHVLLGSSALDERNDRENVEAMRAQGVDGLILSPFQEADADLLYMTELVQEQFPFVTLGAVPNFQTHNAGVDNEKAAIRAVEHLIEQGHARIVFIAGPDHSGHNRERADGYKQAMEKHKLSKFEQVVTAGSLMDDGFRVGESLYRLDEEHPTAVLCYNDLVAFGFINAVTGLGLEVPEDISVVGFDDIPFCECFKVPLTTMSIPACEIGEKAADLLIRQIEADEPLKKERIVLEANLMIRDSVAENQASIGAV